MVAVGYDMQVGRIWALISRGKNPGSEGIVSPNDIAKFEIPGPELDRKLNSLIHIRTDWQTKFSVLKISRQGGPNIA